MSRFGADPRSFFNAVYRDQAPWDVGGPQPGLSALFAHQAPTGPILDVGCGSGDLAIHLAAQGFQVLGIDFAERAIALAWEKAAGQPPEVRGHLKFQVADALAPSRLGLHFGAVVDSGFYHLFEPEQCDRFVDSLGKTLAPGGRYYLLALGLSLIFPIRREVSASGSCVRALLPSVAGRLWKCGQPSS